MIHQNISIIVAIAQNFAIGKNNELLFHLPNDLKLIEVYEQYIPRGHYTRSEDLKMYFKAMMWYGRLTFRLNDDFETQRALLVTQAVRSATAADGTAGQDR